MAFKQKGFNPGVGTGMGNAFTSSPNRANQRVEKAATYTDENSPNRVVSKIVKGVKKLGEKTVKSFGGTNLADGLPKGAYDISVNDGIVTYKVKGHKGEFSIAENRLKERASVNKAKQEYSDPLKRPEADSAVDHYTAKRDAIKAEYDAAVENKDKEAAQAAVKKLQALNEEMKQYNVDLKSGDAPGSYGVKNRTGKMSDFKIGSPERKAEYDRRGWKYDDTIAGYNKDGTKKEESKQNEPESDPTPDPTEVTNKMDDITEPEYQVTSKSGRKTTTATRDGGKVMTDTLTERNIGDKRVTTVTDTDKNRSIRHKQKFDKAGKKRKDKKKITLPDGTVVKVKEKGGKRKVKVRKKGQLFGKKVDPSEFENI